MGKAKEFMKKFGEFLDGKKTTIGAGALVVLEVVKLVSPTLIPPELYNVIENFLYLWTGGGLLHKGYKQIKKN